MGNFSIFYDSETRDQGIKGHIFLSFGQGRSYLQ
jgi:hypothetical protein